MKLGAQKERVRVARQFGDFHEYAIGRSSGKDETGSRKAFDIFWIYLIAMTMALLDARGTVL